MSQGAQEVFQELPHEYVPPEMLQKVAEHGGKKLLNNFILKFVVSHQYFVNANNFKSFNNFV